MKIRQPVYFKDFCCIGSNCSDNCCIGWEIDIDKETEEYYNAVKDKLKGQKIKTLGERLERYISSGEPLHFIMDGERCPFLNKDNLCDLILELGEESLCEICREHPRFYEWFGNTEERGLGLCCEEAARLILQSQESAGFEEWEEEKPAEAEEGHMDERLDGQEEGPEGKLLESFLGARNSIFQLFQDRSFRLNERFVLALFLTEELQKILEQDWNENEKAEKIESVICVFGDRNVCNEILKKTGEKKGGLREECIDRILAFYEGLEPIDEQWTEKVKEMRKHLPAILEKEKEFARYYRDFLYEYEHLAVYFIYRYFMKCYYDGDMVSKMGLAVVSCLFIWLMGVDTWEKTGQFTLKDQIEAAKAYSKEIEYSEENLEYLEEAFWNEEDFSAERLLQLMED